MIYNIYIQDQLWCSIEANDTDDVIKKIGEKFANKKILFDESKPKSIKIEPA